MKEAFTHEVLRDCLNHTCEEMMAELRKIAISTVIREAADCATAITDAVGRLVAQSTGTPGHYNSVPSAVKGMLEQIDASELVEGDVLLTNDPWLCAGHLPDVVIATPVFVDERLVAFAVTVAHHLDMGGKNPGSTTANTTEIFQDGLQLPPLKIVRAGNLQQDILSIIAQNVRMPDTVSHDLESEIAVNSKGQRRLVQLSKKYGVHALLETFERLMLSSERRMRDEIARMPNGEWSWTDFLDDDGQTEESLKIQANLRIEDEDVHVDFMGSAPQAKGGINMTPSFRDSYTQLAIRCFVDPSIPHNEGCFWPVHISAPSGTILSPVRPAPVAGRSVLISRVVDVVMACLSQAVPGRAVAGYGGCNAQPVISGVTIGPGRPFLFLDTNWGGLGGRNGKDGVTCLSFPQNVGNHSIEALEALYPVVIERFVIRMDSEGAGRCRGGFGSIKDYRILQAARLQVPGDRTKHPPFGLEGGGEGALTRYVLLREGHETELRTKREYELLEGDVLSIRTSGGGGLYPPMDREVEHVFKDVTLGYVSEERAWSAYGVGVTRGDSVTESEERLRWKQLRDLEGSGELRDTRQR